MKKIIFSILALSLIVGGAFCQKNIEKEKEAIKKVIQAQLDASRTNSYEGEVAVWAHTPYIVKNETVGWDSISFNYQRNFKARKDTMEQRNVKWTVRKASNFDIYVNGNFASVFHDHYNEWTENGEEKTGDGNRGHKYLEKIDGEWKIIAVFPGQN